MYIWSVVAIIIVVYVGYVFFTEVGKSFPVLELMILIAALQWLFGAFNAYRLSVRHYKYYMYIPEEEYMSFVVPAFLCFIVVLLPAFRKYTIDFNFNIIPYIGYGRWLFVFGVLADIASVVVPSSLLFFVFLIAQFKYVGTGILLFSTQKKDRYVFYAVILYLFGSSLAHAMFHDFILWSLLFFLFWAIKNKPTAKTKLVLFLSGVFFVISIQIVKASFRKLIWEGSFQGNKTFLFYDILSESLSSNYFEDENNLSDLNLRLNQGWIISAIMRHVPDNIEHANGSTVKEAVFSSILPRFLNPNNKKAGGKENFVKYTGLDLGKGTSMGMSIVGEAYVNYGKKRGIIFMAIWGGVLRFYWKRLVKVSRNHPLLIFFIPLLFLQVIKAETELYVVLNHLLKSTFMVWMFFKFAKKYLNWNI